MPNTIADRKVSIRPQERKFSWGRVFPTVVTGGSKDSKWDRDDELVSMGSLRKISTSKGMVLHTESDS